jgi:hypothetical protein
LINALQEAVQIEHGLLIQYLFAALSCKKRVEEGLTSEESEIVRRWEATVLRVARDEMAHLGTVCNMLVAVGGSPNFWRPSFPQANKRWFPFDFQLERFAASSIERFTAFEQPQPQAATLGIAPPQINYEYVGELYRAIHTGFQNVTEELRGTPLFVGSPQAQDDSDWTASLRVFPIHSVSAAQAAIDFIIREGEGTPDGGPDSHYSTFSALLGELKDAQARSKNFDPARNVVTNPVTRAHREMGEGATLIDSSVMAHSVGELFNHTYETMLMLLHWFFQPIGESRDQRAFIQSSARRMMSGIVRPLGELLTELPATKDPHAGRAGPSFEIYGDMRLPSEPAACWAVLIERVNAEMAEAGRLARQASQLKRLVFLAGNLRYLRDGLVSSRGA